MHAYSDNADVSIHLRERCFPNQLVSGSSVGQRVTRSRLTRMGVFLGLSTGLTVTPLACVSSTRYGLKCRRASFLICLVASLGIYTITLSPGRMGLTWALCPAASSVLLSLTNTCPCCLPHFSQTSHQLSLIIIQIHHVGAFCRRQCLLSWQSGISPIQQENGDSLVLLWHLVW